MTRSYSLPLCIADPNSRAARLFVGGGRKHNTASKRSAISIDPFTLPSPKRILLYRLDLSFKVSSPEEWWEAFHGLLVDGRLTREQVVLVARGASVTLREGTAELMLLLRDLGVRRCFLSHVDWRRAQRTRLRHHIMDETPTVSRLQALPPSLACATTMFVHVHPLICLRGHTIFYLHCAPPPPPRRRPPPMLSGHVRAHYVRPCATRITAGIRSLPSPSLALRWPECGSPTASSFPRCAYSRQVPLLIASAGISDIIEETLRRHGLLLENVTIRANTMVFGEDGTLKSFRESPPIHSRYFAVQGGSVAAERP